MRRVYVVLPDSVDDPGRPSGGNVYDRRVCDRLTDRGWDVVECPVPGAWPEGGAASRRRLGAYLAGMPEGALLLVDGLIGSAVPELLEPVSGRLRLVLLVHMPLATPDECRSLRSARRVVTTSAWTRRWLLDRHSLDGQRVHVALPGTDPAPMTVSQAGGGRLLTVGPVARHKGSDVLVAALAQLRGRDWCLVWVGSREIDPEAVAETERSAGAAGLRDRLRLVGPRPAAGMGAAYAAADLLVLPSRAETYGMAVAEALARGVPVVASDVGGVKEALGMTPAGAPGRLVPPGDFGALAGALREWLGDPSLREHWRVAARVRREDLPTWSATADAVETALSAAAA